MIFQLARDDRLGAGPDDERVDPQRVERRQPGRVVGEPVVERTGGESASETNINPFHSAT